ncbi:MAG TPA: MurR/RpiR family transcriptional regulator [Anaeromyxobacter sp.]|nr:MurR/RpiR family transcriptional regulator [Anaeromyxobacter sp.]
MASPFDSVDDFLAAVASQYEGLPKQLRAIAHHIETNRARMVVTRITDIARACGVQPSAVTRFSQRFGFSGYSELQTLFRDAFSASTTPSTSYAKRIRGLIESRRLKMDAGGILRQLLLANQGAIEEFALHLDDRALKAAVTLLHDAEQIYIVGVRRSLSAATYLTYLLQHTSKRVHLVSGLGGTFAGQMRSIGRGDLLVAVSFTPYARETRTCVRIAVARGAKVLAITDSGMSPVARASGTRILVKEASTFSFRSLTNTLCLCQGLFIALASRLEVDLERSHPEAGLDEALDHGTGPG